MNPPMPRGVLDAQIKSLLAARKHQPPASQALAALTWAGDSSRRVPPRHVRESLERVAPHLAPVISSSAWRALVSRARSHVRDSTSPDNRQRNAIRVARVALGHLVYQEVTDRPVAARASRLIVAALAGDVLAQLAPEGNGWVTLKVGMDQLGARLGMTAKSAERGVALAVQMGWLVKLSASRGTQSRFRLPAQLPAHLGQVVDDHGYDAVEALAERDLDHPLVAVLLTADHPGWSAIDGPAWTVALAAAAGVEPSTLGLAVRAHRAARKSLDRSGLGPAVWTGPAINGALDKAADQPPPDCLSGRELRTAGVLAQRARATKRAAQVRTFAAVREVERAAIREKRASRNQEPAQALLVEPVVHAPSGELRMDLPTGFEVGLHGSRFKEAMASRDLDVVGVRLAAGHAVVRPLSRTTEPRN